MLGGGRLLLALAGCCKSEELPIYVITAPRQVADKIKNGRSLDKILSVENILSVVVEDIVAEEVLKLLDDLKDAFCLSIGATWIFKKETINGLFYGRLFNLHVTRLPQN